MSKTSATTLVDHPWSLDADEVLRHWSVSIEQGLDLSEVRRRRNRFGPNRLREPQRISVWQILFAQVKSLIVVLLAVAAIASMFFDQWVEAFAIIAVIGVNTAIGFVTELRAVRSMEALRQLGGATAIVRRKGETKQINADLLVPGDIVVLDAGDSINADMRLIEASKLQANESALTGESVPVSKRVDRVDDNAPLADRSNMLFKGTFLTRGSGTAVVVGTGMDTELGRIASLVEAAAEDELTPLEKRLDRLGRELIWITLGITVVVALLGIVRGKDVFLMIETGVALAVAAIPEGLPIVATLALAKGMMRLARRNVLIRRLAAVETLGATNVICTDKTGTLTENRMTVTRLVLDGGTVTFGNSEGITSAIDEDDETHSSEDNLREALEIGVLCNNASLSRPNNHDAVKVTGDPMEVALLIAGASMQIDRNELVQHLAEVREVAFDPDVKMMATFHAQDNRFLVAVKGAPESVLESSTLIRTANQTKPMAHEERERWLQRNVEMAGLGLRVLALATKTTDQQTDTAYRDLTLLGLVAMEDPPRQDVRPAITACQDAGIKLVMVTGDQTVTARKIASDVGLIDHETAVVIEGGELDQLASGSSETDRRRVVETAIFARVSPKQKLDLIDAHQRNGSIVAMTGDGVNDAPALEKADIGVAMGKRGTQVAREASDMVLEDDALSSIVVAVSQGRIIFGNIRKFVIYLLSCNTSEVMVVALASLVNAPLPILPLQILFLNLVTDVFPALALGVGPGDPNVMKRPPRDPKEPFLPTAYWWAIAGYSVAIASSVLIALALALVWLDMDERRAVTVSFLTLAFAQLWHVFNMRDRGAHLFSSDIARNPYVWGALALCTILILAGVYLPGLSHVLQVQRPGWEGWTLALSLSFLPWLAGTLFHYAAGFHRLEKDQQRTT